MGLVWREQLSVGNGVIDADHKHLIGIINRVEHCLTSKDRGEFEGALDDLSQYASVHFDREEKIAAAAGYTKVPHLSDSHRALLQNLEQVRGEIDAMGSNWSPEAITHITGFLRDWLLDHVIKEDLLMRPILLKYSPSFDPR